MPTPQEQYWAGPAGDAYTARNDESLLAAKQALFAQVFLRTGEIGSAIEFGANRGLNLRAIQKLAPEVRLTAVEINADACNAMLETLWTDRTNPPPVVICHASLFDLRYWPKAQEPHDLACTKGLLIHIAPEDLPKAYDALYRASSRYILIAEYFSPTPVEVEYRGELGRLWKRDFAGEMLDRYPDLKVADYGFVWRRDPEVPMDDISWFLLERS